MAVVVVVLNECSASRQAVRQAGKKATKQSGRPQESRKKGSQGRQASTAAAWQVDLFHSKAGRPSKNQRWDQVGKPVSQPSAACFSPVLSSASLPDTSVAATATISTGDNMDGHNPHYL